MSPLHYGVYTPQFTDWGVDRDDSPETSVDWVEVFATSKREAKVLGVRQMRAEGMHWVQDQRSDGASPFTGLKAEPMTCEHGRCQCSGDHHEDCPECWANPEEM